MYLDMDTPLNLAHRHQRKAETLLRRGNFDGAISHHKKAAELLSQAFSETTSTSAKESIQLQIEYHSRQQIIMKHRQKEAERRHQRNLEIKQSRENKVESLPKNSEHSVTKELVQQARRTMVEHDSLLACVFLGTQYCPDSCNPTDLMSRSAGGIKSPKDDLVRLEELRINNEELKRVLFVMIDELETSRAENERLRNSFEELQRVHASCPPSANVRLLDIAQNSSDFFSSPVDTRNNSSVCDLPALAPIEMPKYDF